MKNIFLANLVVLSVSVVCSAQIDSFDISTYARPDLHRKQLDLFVNINLGNTNNKINSEPINYKLTGYSSATIRKATFENTSRIQATGRWSANVQAALNKSDSIVNLKSFGQYSLFKRARHYKNDNKFIEIEYGLNSIFIRSRNENRLNSFENTLRVLGNFRIALGKGRFEFVTDAWQAMTILEELQKLSLLKSTDLSQDLISQFADEIAIVKKKRFTDPRFFSINEYEQIIALMDKEGLIDTQDFRFFGHFFDLWNNERFVSRLHGKTFRYGLGVELDEPDLLSSTNYKANQRLTAFVAVQDYKAISKDWQLDKTLGVELHSNWEELPPDANIFQQGHSLILQPNFNLILGYYPSLRRNYEVDFDARYSVTFNGNDRTPGYSTNDDIIVSLFGSYNYYVSPQFTWSLSGNLFLRNQNFNDITSRFDNSNGIEFSTVYSFY